MKTTEEINNQIINERLEYFNKKEGPRVGDYVKLDYGFYTRITYMLNEQVQTGGTSEGSYYFGGSCSYSGSCDGGVKRSDLIPTDETKEGRVWIFSEHEVKAHNGVDFKVPFRVFTLKEGADKKGLWDYKQFLKNRDWI